MNPRNRFGSAVIHPAISGGWRDYGLLMIDTSKITASKIDASLISTVDTQDGSIFIPLDMPADERAALVRQVVFERQLLRRLLSPPVLR